MQITKVRFLTPGLALILCAALLFAQVGCMKNTTTNPPGSPNVGVIVALDSASAACLISSGLVSGPVSTWLAGPCRTAMTGILNIVEANGTAAQIAATIATLQATIAELPPGTPYLTYANAALALAQEVLTIYEQVTGQTVTPSTARIAAPTPSRQIMWTNSERAHIDSLKARLAH